MIYTEEELTTFDERISGDQYFEKLDGMVDENEISDDSEVDDNTVNELGN